MTSDRASLPTRSRVTSDRVLGLQRQRREPGFQARQLLPHHRGPRSRAELPGCVHGDAGCRAPMSLGARSPGRLGRISPASPCPSPPWTGRCLRDVRKRWSLPMPGDRAVVHVPRRRTRMIRQISTVGNTLAGFQLDFYGAGDDAAAPQTAMWYAADKVRHQRLRTCMPTSHRLPTSTRPTPLSAVTAVGDQFGPAPNEQGSFGRMHLGLGEDPGQGLRPDLRRSWARPTI